MVEPRIKLDRCFFSFFVKEEFDRVHLNVALTELRRRSMRLCDSFPKPMRVQVFKLETFQPARVVDSIF